MAAKRSRTGCQTCRARKLKCDEIRPICGQCIKSRRDCIPSEGIAFRHEQNASINAAQPGDQKGLANFFKYRNQYDANEIFVPIPKELTFVIITDPYSEEQNPSSPPASPGSYQQVAAHSLEALSTAATDHPSYGHQSNFADYSNAFPGGGGNNGSRSGYGPAGTNIGGSGGGQHGSNNQNANINFLLNPSNTPSSLIDPSLETSLGTSIHRSDDHDQHHHHDEHDVSMKYTKSDAENDPSSENKTDAEDHPDAQLALLLRDHQATHGITA